MAVKRIHSRSRSATASGAATGNPARRSVAQRATATAVLQQFRELFRVSQRHFQRIESRCGVSGAQLWALCEIARQPGLTISEIARVLSVHLSTSSNLLDKLQDQGLVRRERTSADQRLVRVYVTADGKRLLARAPKPVEGVIPDALSKLPSTALRRLQGDLQVLLQVASARSARASMKPLGEP